MGDQSAPPDEEATSVSVGTSLAPPSYVSHEPIYPSTADNSVGLTATQASLLFDKRGGTLDSAPTRRRPSSAGGNLTSRSRSGSIAGGVSAHTSLVSRSSIVLTMQADIDRRRQRERELEAKRLEEQREQLAYEEEKRKKLLRASATASEFTGLLEREQKMREKQLLKEEERKKKEEEEQKAQAEARKEQLRKRMEDAAKTRSTLTWDQIQEQQELERRQRKARRKEELLQSAAYPGELGARVEAWKSKQSAPPPPPEGKVFRAQTPEQIARSLQRSKDKWDATVKKRKEAVEAARLTQLPEEPKEVKAMRLRQEEFERRRKEAVEARQAKEEQEKKKEMEREKERKEKLLAAPVPEGRSTKMHLDRIAK
eukprot:gene8951-11481_t